MLKRKRKEEVCGHVMLPKKLIADEKNDGSNEYSFFPSYNTTYPLSRHLASAILVFFFWSL